jgi:hypothetical protein
MSDVKQGAELASVCHFDRSGEIFFNPLRNFAYSAVQIDQAALSTTQMVFSI